MSEKAKVIFGNPMPAGVYRKAVRSKQKYVRRFGDDSAADYPVTVEKNAYIGGSLGVMNVLLGESGSAPQKEAVFDEDKGIIVGNIRMGFGHYRISMAIASAAKSMGCTPYWMDLNSYRHTTCTKVISAQNDLYSLGSRLSGKSRLFNKLVWEPMNYEGFRKLSYNASDQKNAELMAAVYRNVPKEIPVVATHVWPAQAAVHAGMKHVDTGQLAYGAAFVRGQSAHGADALCLSGLSDPERHARRRGAGAYAGGGAGIHGPLYRS